MGALAGFTTLLPADVANGATYTVAAYPAGSSQAQLNGTVGGVVVIGENDIYRQGTGVAITYGASTITITNNSGTTWTQGQRLRASFGRTDKNGVYNLVVGTTAQDAKAGNL